MFRAILPFLLLMGLAGCQSSGINAKQYNNSLAQVQLGMTKQEFVQLFPSATPRGAKAYPGGSVEVLEQIVADYRFAPSYDPSYARNTMTGVESRTTWFYFYNNKLVQYGLPNDWPLDPDRVIQIQAR